MILLLLAVGCGGRFDTIALPVLTDFNTVSNGMVGITGSSEDDLWLLELGQGPAIEAHESMTLQHWNGHTWRTVEPTDDVWVFSPGSSGLLAPSEGMSLVGGHGLPSPALRAWAGDERLWAATATELGRLTAEGEFEPVGPLPAGVDRTYLEVLSFEGGAVLRQHQGLGGVVGDYLATDSGVVALEPPPNTAPADLKYTGVFAADDLWGATLTPGTPTEGAGTSTTIVHFDGATWTAQELLGVGTGWMLRTNDGFAWETSGMTVTFDGSDSDQSVNPVFDGGTDDYFSLGPAVDEHRSLVGMALERRYNGGRASFSIASYPWIPTDDGESRWGARRELYSRSACRSCAGFQFHWWPRLADGTFVGWWTPSVNDRDPEQLFLGRP